MAESIIAYKIINGGSSLTDIVWNDAGYYTVYYKDALGRELSEAYQYSVDKNGNVSVNKVDIKYEATGGTKVTITNKHDQKPDNIGATEAPSTKYEIQNGEDGTGTTDVVITVNGIEYRNPSRQINPDGTISYILVDDNSHRELFVVKADGSEGYYTKYNKTNQLLNNDDKNTETKTYTVNGKSYTVAGGTNTIGVKHKYAVVQDQYGIWHKLVYEGNRQLVISSNGKFYLQANGIGSYEYIEEAYELKTDMNGKYGLYDQSGQLKYQLAISSDASYTPKASTTTYTYNRVTETGEMVEGHDEALSNYHSQLESESEAISTSESEAVSDSESASSTSESNSNLSSGSASEAKSLSET